MKRKIYLIALSLIVVSSAFSQENVFKTGDGILNIGIGLGSTLYSGSFYKTSVPPISASYEYGLKDGVLDKGVVSLGGYVGYSSYKYDVAGWGWKYSDFILAIRGNLHYPILEKVDTYGGVMLGFQIVSVSEYGNVIAGYNYNTQGSRALFSLYVGGRYYFNEKVGAFAELGYGVSWLTLGVALKLK